LVFGAVAVFAAAPLCVAAQDVQQMSVTGSDASPATKAALTGAMILAGASGAQLIKTPDPWPRTIGGFGSRVADQTGFYIVQTTTFRSVSSVLDYRPDAVLCPKSALVSCAFVSTFTAFNRVGERRANWPMISSIIVGTGASLAWRPERHDNAKAWGFVGTRLAIGFGGYVAERLVVDWWAQR
jgi:hypothetical protein